MNHARLPVLLAVAALGLGAAGLAHASDPKPARKAPATEHEEAAPAKAKAKGHGQAPSAPASVAAPPPVAAPSAAEGDPMERLRQRLADRLAGPAGNESSGTIDLRVSTARAVAAPKAAAHAVAHTPTTAAAHGSPKASARSPAGGAHAPAAGAGHGGEAHWAYEGAQGPAAWGAMKPEFNLCASGQRQSPIDIRGGLPVGLEPVQFDYRPTAFSVIDNGHTVQVNLAPGNSIDVGGRRFDLVQFHFHRPSEERIDGRQFEMSLHLVHKDAEGRLAVVGVLLDRGPAHPAVQMVWNNLPLERGQEQPARVQLNPIELLPNDKRYYTYMGSLTTPPCSEGVLWVVMRSPATMAAEQVGIFSRIYPMNARPVQSIAGRRILQSD